MGTVNISVYGCDYPIACDDGQESHVAKLAQMVADRVKQLSQQMGRGPEHTMLIYTALMLADELAEQLKENKRLKKDLKDINNGQLPLDSGKLEEMEAAMAASMQQIAGRIEKLADKLSAS